MWKKRAIKVFLLVAVLGVSFSGTAALNRAESGAYDSNALPADSNSSQRPSKPMIIWWGSATLYRDVEILRLALSSGVFSHAVLAERNDLQRPNYLSNPNFRKALSICRENKVKVIWSRWVYPSQPIRGLEPEDIFSASYYVKRIRKIKKEAKEIGADLVCLDAEPYAKSPAMKLKSHTLTEAEFNKLTAAIKEAVKVAGQVDLVIPEGAHYKPHLYDVTRMLGKNVMALGTYNDVPPTPEQKPYDIFGAAVSITKENKRRPDHPYFTPREILERQELWAHKKGLFIYAMGKEDADIKLVALEFSKIKTIYPVRDSNDTN
jgi:hypothetical protein